MAFVGYIFAAVSSHDQLRKMHFKQQSFVRPFKDAQFKVKAIEKLIILQAYAVLPVVIVIFCVVSEIKRLYWLQVAILFLPQFLFKYALNRGNFFEFPWILHELC